MQGLSRALLAEAAEARVEAEVIEAEAAPHGLMSALVSLRGDGAEALARSWEGTVQWICPSPLRPGWGRKRTEAVIRKVSSVATGRIEARQITVGWLLDPRSGGRRFAAWLDALEPKTGPAWPGFPFVRKEQ